MSSISHRSDYIPDSSGERSLEGNIQGNQSPRNPVEQRVSMAAAGRISPGGPPLEDLYKVPEGLERYIALPGEMHKMDCECLTSNTIFTIGEDGNLQPKNEYVTLLNAAISDSFRSGTGVGLVIKREAAYVNDEGHHLQYFYVKGDSTRQVSSADLKRLMDADQNHLEAIGQVRTLLEIRPEGVERPASHHPGLNIQFFIADRILKANEILKFAFWEMQNENFAFLGRDYYKDGKDPTTHTAEELLRKIAEYDR
jgi:hypothetical protein